MPEPRPSYPRDYFSSPIPLKDIAFILMPFDGFDEVHTAIRKAVKHARTLRPDLAGLEPVRADDLRRKVVLEKILGQIGEAKVVIADLTGRNANVFYELGIAQTLKNVILLAQNSKDVPADLQPFEYVPYTNSKEGLEKLVVDLAETIRQQPEETPTTVLQDSGTPQDTKRYLQRSLQDCEDRWIGETIPAQNTVFEEQFQQRLAATTDGREQLDALAEAIEVIQPAFLGHWRAVEEIGLEAIDEGTNELLPRLMQALERAFSTSTRLPEPSAYPTVVGYTQLLTLRTWSLWGALALRAENWDAVSALLHSKINFEKAGWYQPRHSSFVEYRPVHAPDAAGVRSDHGDQRLAILSVYNQTDDFARQRFFDLQEMQGFIRLWQFACDLAYAALVDADEATKWPVWVYGPTAPFTRLFPRIENGTDFAGGFAQAVAKCDPVALNRIYEGGLRDKFLNSSQAWQLSDHELPKRFAEPERRAINWSRPS